MMKRLPLHHECKLEQKHTKFSVNMDVIPLACNEKYTCSIILWWLKAETPFNVYKTVDYLSVL